MSGRTGHTRTLSSLLYGAAHVMDFTGALSRRSFTENVTEDLSLAWLEIYDGLPRIVAADHAQGPEVPRTYEGQDVGAATVEGNPEAQEGLVALTMEVTPTVSPNTEGERSNDPFELSELGYRGPTAVAVAGVTLRQLDYWARAGLVEPSIRAAGGQGTQRLYGFRDILVLKVIKRLLDTGISLHQIRAAVKHLREKGSGDLAEVTLMSDGVSVYECTSPDEIADLLQGGFGVFGIALGRVWQEVEESLIELPAERGTRQMPSGWSDSEERPGESARLGRTADGGAA
jgi:DNA-binding transcriptional MerR regulator